MYPGRTTTVLVSALIEVDTSFDLTQFIDWANEIVTEVCDPYYMSTTPPVGYTPGTPTGNYVPYTAYRLEMIERWMAAHAYTVLDPRSAHERLGPISESYQGKIDLGFDSSIYGQNAMRLDTQGGLARMNNRQNTQVGYVNLSAGVRWLGTPNRRGSWAGGRPIGPCVQGAFNGDNLDSNIDTTI